MGIRKYKPTTPGRRGASVADFVEITRSEPEKSLVRPCTARVVVTRTAGSRHATRVAGTSGLTGSSTSGGDKDGVPANVTPIEFNPTAPPGSAAALRGPARSATSSRRPS